MSTQAQISTQHQAMIAIILVMAFIIFCIICDWLKNVIQYFTRGNPIVKLFLYLFLFGISSWIARFIFDLFFLFGRRRVSM